MCLEEDRRVETEAERKVNVPGWGGVVCGGGVYC